MSARNTARDAGRIENKKARFRFHVSDRVEAGVVLIGSEVKALREHNANLGEAYARIRGDEVFLHNLHIGPYAPAGPFNHDPKRVRKLLLRRPEIRRLAARVSEKGTTVVPLAIFFRRGFAKVELGVARGKGEIDRREDIKRREAERDMRRAAAPRGGS